MPSPVEAFPCGSMSRTSVGWPTAASAVPRLMAVVVLPTPPFWLATTRTRGLTGSGMMKLPDFENCPRRVRTALMPKGFYIPRFMGLGQFGLKILSLEEQANSVRAGEMLCIAQQAFERRAGPRGNDVKIFVCSFFDSRVADLDVQVEPFGRGAEKGAFLGCRFIEHRAEVRPFPKKNGQYDSREPGSAAEVN